MHHVTRILTKCSDERGGGDLLHVEEPIHQLTGLGPALFLYALTSTRTPRGHMPQAARSIASGLAPIGETVYGLFAIDARRWTAMPSAAATASAVAPSRIVVAVERGLWEFRSEL
jgi:hypothetical protein